MPLSSGILEGFVRHRRFAPRPHAFRYPLFMMYLDLAELPTLFDGMWSWSASRPALARVNRSDYLADPCGGREGSLDEAVRARVAAATGIRPAGPIRLLAHPRYFGYVFNPVSFYYCFDAADQHIDTIVAEITNTPWNERHAYVLHDARPLAGRAARFSFDKAFHVSPFMPMDLRYDWSFSPPPRAEGERLGVHMTLEKHGVRQFDATMVLRRREITPPALRAQLVRYPLMTARVIAGIHFQALRLWMKRTPWFPNPTSVARAAGPSPATPPRVRTTAVRGGHPGTNSPGIVSSADIPSANIPSAGLAPAGATP